MDHNRGNWYLLTALLLGLAIGLVYAWVVAPATQVDTHPNLLREDYKDIYRSMIARAYQANQNLPRAEARLELIGDKEPALALAAQAQRFLAESGDNENALILANLSAALQSLYQPAPTAVRSTITPIADLNSTQNGSGTGSNPAADTTPSPANGAVRSPTPSPTDSPPFILQDSSPICDPTLGESLIQVIATDSSGKGVPGVSLEISLGTNPLNVFYTGLKPELGLGYADFTAEPGLTYQLEIQDSGLVISKIEVPTCQTDSGDSFWGSWEVYITHPN